MKGMELKRFEEKAKELRVLGMKISIGQDVVYEHYWDEDCRRNIYSASKSFTSCAVGFALQEGLVRLDEKLEDAFWEYLPAHPDHNLKKATIEHLLTMTLGQEKGFLMGSQRPYIAEKDWVKASLEIPFVYEPGTRFVYNNVGPYLAGILVQMRAGCNLLDYLTPRLFKPLGIRRTVWEEDPQGFTFGAGGLFLTISELHKLGLLYLQDGVWDGRQILSPQWIGESLRKHVENDKNPYGYGYLFWGGDKNSFMANGKYGQYTMIFRDKHAVISLFAESRDTGRLERTVIEDVYRELP